MGNLKNRKKIRSNMELKLIGDQFGLAAPFPFNVIGNILAEEHGIDNLAGFVEGFIEGFSYMAAIATWLITEVVAPDRAPFIMADAANFVFNISGLSDHPEHTNNISQ